MNKLKVIYYGEPTENMNKVDARLEEILEDFAIENHLKFDGTSYGFKNEDRTLYWYNKK